MKSTEMVQDVPVTSSEELDRIREIQEIEAGWWKNMPVMNSDSDIEQSIQNGDAVRILDGNANARYKISAKVEQKFRVLELHTAELLQIIARRWTEDMNAEGQSQELFLVVSSLGRTIERQKELIAKGYPAVENSTHTKLGAFDIATKWLRDNNPEALLVLERILKELSGNGEINFIPEDTIGAYHIASRPRTKE